MASSWSTLSNLPSLTNGFNPDTMLLLTDGSVLVHNSQGANGGKEWFRLTPDDQGHYDTGSWSGALNMTNTRQFFASGVLMDGRVFVVGGEYSDAGGDTPLGEIFDPSTNAWGSMNKPAAFNFIQGDCSACGLPDGRVIFGDINSQRSAIWDPAIDQWVETGFQFGTTNVQSKQGKTNEETWTLLPDGTVLSVETFNPNAAEKYIPSQDRWVSASSTQAALPITQRQAVRYRRHRAHRAVHASRRRPHPGGFVGQRPRFSQRYQRQRLFHHPHLQRWRSGGAAGRQGAVHGGLAVPLFVGWGSGFLLEPDYLFPVRPCQPRQPAAVQLPAR
jgi:hypothetical protein